MMPALQQRQPPRVVAVLLTLGLLASCPPVSAGTPEPETSLVEIGRRIYEDGILPGGEPLRAIRPEGFEMEGHHAACVTCHRRSGMGSLEGSIDSTILVPPVAGPLLFAPARFATSFLDDFHHYVPNDAWRRALTRPAYDRQSLGRSLREGLDPGDRRLVAPMPRYPLDDTAVAALDAYLRQLSSAPAPGVAPEALHLATVVTPDAPTGKAEAALGVLRAWSEGARGSGAAWRLHVWRLSGPPGTWPAQLEQHYRRQPVFAVLGGVGGAEWGPVHHFCEQQRLACVLPVVEVAPDPGDDWYSMYYSPGVGLEARVLARYLDEQAGATGSRGNLIQVYSDAAGRHAAEVLESALASTSGSVSLRKYRATAPRAALTGLSAGDRLILWLRPAEIEQLASAMPQGPPAGSVFLSALLATPETISLPARWKPRTRFVSLFDDLGLQGSIARLRLDEWLEAADLTNPDHRRVQADVYAACYLFNDALGHIREQEVRRLPVPLNREHLLETLETLVNKYNDSTNLIDTDSHVAYYGRMSLGPRQRVAVQGGTVMRYPSADTDRLVPASKRIVP